MYFWTYWLWKTWLDKRLKSIVLEDPLTSNMVNGRKHCWNLNDSTFTIFIDPCRLKKSLILICKIFELFVNTLSAHYKHSVLSKGNFLQHYQMQLSQKQKILPQFVFAFSKCRFIFEHFQKKYDPYSWCIFELTDCEKRG